MKMESKPWLLSTQLVWAIKENNFSKAQEILDAGLDVDCEIMMCKSAINVAILNGCVDIAKLLISRNCSLSLKTGLGSTPLHLAVHMQSLELVQLLIANRADMTGVDILGKTPLHIACEMKNTIIAHLLIEKATSSTINIRDRDKKTPLLYACGHGSIDVIKSLLNKGAKTHVTDNLGNNLLMYAITNSNCSVEMVNALLDSGADINHRNKSKQTVLFQACCMVSWYKEIRLQGICELLISRGCDVNAVNTKCETALHVSITNEFLVRKLLNAGSDIDAPNQIGRTPLICALDKGSLKISDLLIEAGASIRCAQAYFLSRVHVTPVSDETYRLLRIKAKECQRLKNLCRTIIRKELHTDINKTAQLLPLPDSMKQFIQFSID